jgi:hypothetical protein
MAIIDQLDNSQLSLQGNGFDPHPNRAAWGYKTPQVPIDPELSNLHFTYSVDGDPHVKIKDFNRAALGGITRVKEPSMIDELDPNAPNNYQAGNGGVVSQIYKSSSGRNYKDLGPSDGRY